MALIIPSSPLSSYVTWGTRVLPSRALFSYLWNREGHPHGRQGTFQAFHVWFQLRLEMHPCGQEGQGKRSHCREAWKKQSWRLKPWCQIEKEIVHTFEHRAQFWRPALGCLFRSHTIHLPSVQPWAQPWRGKEKGRGIWGCEAQKYLFHHIHLIFTLMQASCLQIKTPEVPHNICLWGLL